MRFKVGALVFCLGNVDALELEDDRARAIIAAGYHHAGWKRPGLFHPYAGMVLDVSCYAVILTLTL